MLCYRDVIAPDSLQNIITGLPEQVKKVTNILLNISKNQSVRFSLLLQEFLKSKIHQYLNDLCLEAYYNDKK